MRVGIEIILSVLSSSVLAAVIPNYDSHGILLVRRAGSLENNAVSWNKNDGDQVKFIPLSSGAGAGAQTSTSNGESNPDYSSGNRGSGKLGKFYMSFKKSWNTQKHKVLQWRDKRKIKNAAKKLTGVVAGEEANNFITDIEKFLHTTLEGARMAFESYDDPDIAPFFLFVPKGSNQKLLTQKMVRVQKSAKGHAKKYLENVTRGIDSIIKNPQDVVKEMEKIMDSISAMCMALTLISGFSYTDLISEVGRRGNEKHIEDTNTYIAELKGYKNGASKSFNSIKEYIIRGIVTFKGKNPSKISNFKSGVRSRLGIKSKSSTGVPPNPEPSDEKPSDENTSNQGESNQGPPDQQAPDQKGTRPTPAPRLSKPNTQEFLV
ncbi:hypothetical protein BASA61_003122 [Batrachochytrium salamandrivorans]|nr:hypothetical protein BASA61_003122 [Batrachochytrium salamandrivorans]